MNTRYFIFGAVFSRGDTTISANTYGVTRFDFPSVQELKNDVLEKEPTAHKIKIMSICEVSQKDYTKFFS